MSVLVTSVCADDPEHQGLVQDLDKLYRLVSSANSPPVDKIEGIFQYFDVSRIPNPANKPTETDERAVDLALVSMLVILACERHLKTNRMLDASLSAVWPSVWKWLEYLDTECCQKGVFSADLYIRGLVGIAYTLSTYGASEALRRLATSTPGVITMLAKYWLAPDQQPGIEPLLKAAGIDGRYYTRALDIMLQAEDTSPHCLLPDIIAATPGGAKSVVRTGILHLNNDASKKNPDFRSICRDLSLINNFCCKSCPALQLALLNHGIIPTLVKMLSLFNAQTMDNTDVIYCVKMCYSILIKAFQCANGTSWIVQAFDSGLLQVLLKSGRRLAKLNESNRNLCTTLLSDILCQYLVYHSVLCSVGKVLRRVERLDIGQDVAGPLWDGWLLFKGLAQERINFAIQVENDDVRRKDCNRIGVSGAGFWFIMTFPDGLPLMQCDQTNEADSLLRCSSCLSTLYCGRNCQRLDWPSHKSSCQQLKRALQGISVASYDSFRSSNF